MKIVKKLIVLKKNKKITTTDKLPTDQINQQRKRHAYVWNSALPIIARDPVDIYLKSRGIILTAFPSDLRYHPQLPYYNEENFFIGKFPAMLALVKNENDQCVTIHRTYLGDRCKANLPQPKKLMSPIFPGATKGGAIKLFEPIDGKLAIAEGIETSFAFTVATGIPTWACISAIGMKQIIIPKSVIEVIILVDNDLSGTGQEAASVLSKRLLIQGFKVKRVIPPMIGTDFADMLMEDK